METVNSLTSKSFITAKLGLDLELLDRFMVEHNIPREAIDKLEEYWSKEFDDFEVKMKWFLADWIAEDIIKTLQGEEPWNRKRKEDE